MQLKKIGWNKFFEDIYEDKTLKPGRIFREMKKNFMIFSKDGKREAIVSDLLWKKAFVKSELPVVGDWILFSEIPNSNIVKIEKVLQRKSKFSRKVKDTFGRNYSKAGGSDEQIISANIDIVFLVIALDRDFKVQKIERYLTLIRNSGTKPVLILNKADQCKNPQKYLDETKRICGDTDVFVISAKEEIGVENLYDYLEEGKTITVIGSSGVGKSTLINHFLGYKKMFVNQNRESDRRGRHTTTHRELILLPSGAMLIDNPGIRDVKLVATEESLNETFADIEELSKDCKFRNCQHLEEPGCAVKKAIITGEITEKRYANFIKLRSEVRTFKTRKYFSDKYRESGKWKEKKFK